MDLLSFVIVKWASLLVDIVTELALSFVFLSKFFTGLAALMSADIARFIHWSGSVLTVTLHFIYFHLFQIRHFLHYD